MSNPTTLKFFPKLITVTLILVISISSGIHRALLSILYGTLTGTSFGDQLLNNVQGAPLEVWLTLALSLAPFGLAKSFADWIGGLSSDRSSAIAIMRIGGLFSILAAGTVIIAIFVSNLSGGVISGLLLGLATGLFGITEGLFYVGATIRLTNLFSNKSRGFSVGLMESSVYSGYTLGAIISGFLSSNSIDLFTPYFFAIIISVFTLFLALSQSRITKKKTPEEIKGVLDRQRYSLRLFIARPRVAAILIFAHIGKYADAYIWILPLFLTTKLLIQGSPDYLAISFVISAYTASWALMMLISSRVSDVVGRKWPVFYGFVLTSLGMLGLAVYNELYLLILSSIILGIGTGMFYPVLTIIAIDIVVRPAQGEMIGILRSIRDLGYFTAPFIVCTLAWFFGKWQGRIGGSLKNLEEVGIFIALLLLLMAIFQLIFLRESRPPWIVLDLIIAHAKLVEKIVEISSSAFSLDNIHNRIKAMEIVKETELLESEADTLKTFIRKSMMHKILPSADDALFLDILRVNDYIAGRAVISATKLQFIPINKVPSDIVESLALMGISFPFVMHELVKSMVLLEEKIYLAVQATKDIRKLESAFDHHYSRTLHHLYKNEVNFEFDRRFAIMTTIKECAEALEDGVDYIEHSADLITILGEKYRP